VNTEKTYTLRDLETTEFSGTPLAVVGHPIQHSVSPAMHNAALAKLRETDSRFIDWAYYRFDIAPEDFAQALVLFHKRCFLGLNLTIPHKVQALDLIQGVSADAKSMGAVNTLVRDELGYDGFNTDGYGLSRGLELDLDVPLKDANVILLGSGGAARAAAVQCMLSGCAQLYVGNRTPERLQDLLAVLDGVSGKMQIRTFALHELPQDLPECGVVVNATSLGLQPSDPAPIDVAQLPTGWKVYDMIYNPTKTALLEQASARALPFANGLSMLVQQGARSLELWSHSKVDAHAMLNAACHSLQLPPRYA
jgi:shikimate dehydrogenase